MARLCRERMIVEKVDTGPCAYETINPRSPFCSWHRELRTDVPGQELHRLARLEAATGAPQRTRVPESEWPDGQRWCAGCQSFVPLFACRGSRCVPCARAAGRVTSRRGTYGVEPEVWDALMAVQDGRCAICRKRQRDRDLAADHDHKLGNQLAAVRGAACTVCNQGLGGAFDSRYRLTAMLVYLLAPPMSGRWLAPEVIGDEVLAAVTAVLDRAHSERGATSQAKALVEAITAASEEVSS